MSNCGKFMVTMTCGDMFASFKIYDADVGRLESISLYTKTLHRLVNGASNYEVESDGNHYCRMAVYKENVHFVFNVLKVNNSGKISGQQETFCMSIEEVAKFLNNGYMRKIFYKDAEKETAHLEISYRAHKLIHKYAGNKNTRHAIRKAFKTNFKYGKNEVVRLYDDWGEFGFSTEGLCGGLIVHTQNRRGRDGKMHPETYFGIHT